MREQQRYEVIKNYFVEHVASGDSAQIASIFPSRKVSWCGLFESTEIILPRNKVATLSESLPLHAALVSSEFSSIVSDICGYQETRQKRWFAYGAENDPINAVLEELKQWCHSFEEKKEIDHSISEINRRIKYIEALSNPTLFPSRAWTRLDSETMLGVLEKVRKRLLDAKTHLQNEKKVSELRDKLSQLKTLAQTVVYQGVHYLTFVFRDTPDVNISVGNVFTLQNNESQEIKKLLHGFLQTESGKLVHELANHPLLKRMFRAIEKKESSHNHTNYQEASLCLLENPFIVIDDYHYNVREELLERFKKVNVSPRFKDRFQKSPPLGIDPLFLQPSSEEGLKSFLKLHGLMIELARVQRIVETAENVVTTAGHASLAYLYQAVEAMALSYQFLCISIETEMKTMKKQIQQLSFLSASKAWRDENKKKVKDYRKKIRSHLQEANENLLKVVKLSSLESPSQIVCVGEGLPQLFMAQAGIMQHYHGIHSPNYCGQSQQLFQLFSEGLFSRCLLKKVKEVMPALNSFHITDEESAKQLHAALAHLSSQHLFVLMLKSALDHALKKTPLPPSHLMHHIQLIQSGDAMTEFLFGFWLIKLGQNATRYENRLLVHAANGDRLAGIYHSALSMASLTTDFNKLTLVFSQDELQFSESLGDECDEGFLSLFKRMCELVKKYLLEHLTPALTPPPKRLQLLAPSPSSISPLQIELAESESYSPRFLGSSHEKTQDNLEVAKAAVIENIKLNL